MPIVHDILSLSTDASIGIYNLTSQLQTFLAQTSIRQGQLLVYSRHTTTALAVNEYEERLLEDIKGYLRKLAPEGDRYLHNDLHLRDVPENEPENAHSHLMALLLHNHEVVPIVDGTLALGTYQSVFFVELDGPRDRTVFVQASGEP